MIIYILWFGRFEPNRYNGVPLQIEKCLQEHLLEGVEWNAKHYS